MSILLDALRKSEQRERLGATPDIHSSDPAIDSPAPGRRRSLALGLLAALVLVAVAWGGWVWWSEYRVPGAAPTLSTAPSPAQPADAGAAVADPPGSEPAASAGPRLSSQPRSPVENLSGDRPYRPAAAQAPPTPAAAPRVPPRTQPEISDADFDAAIDQSAAAAQRRAEARARRQAANRPPPQEPDDGSISYWQLPENVRGGMPPMKINVMVYDEDPTRRFIIMGGKRFGENDEVSPGLTVEKVERDRALFRYGAYLFFLKQ